MTVSVPHADDLDSAQYPRDHARTRAMALNVAAWTDDSVRCYGVPTHRTGALWWRDPGGSGIYLAAVVCDAESPDEQLLADLGTVQDAWGDQEFLVYECWGTRDLSRTGMTKEWQNPWYLRPSLSELPLATGATMLEGLTVETVNTPEQLAEFERASVLGFSDGDADMEQHKDFSWHHPATLDNPDMVYLLARLHGTVVAGTIVHATADMVGIYGISTLVEYRRRGYATALVRASLALRPDLPTSVYPDPPSVPIYTGMGFFPAGEIAAWKHVP